MELRTHLEQLESCAQLRRISQATSPDLELARLCRREFAASDGGQALLFEAVSGCPSFRAVGNLFGNSQRVAQLLHCESLEQFAGRLRDLLEQGSGSATERLVRLSRDAQESPESSGDEPEEYLADLRRLPGIRSWPGETGRYLTLGLTATADPESGMRNLGLYRVQILDEKRLAVNFSPHSGAGEHLARAARSSERLPVSIFFGGDPALIWLAAAPLPQAVDDYQLFRRMFESIQPMSSGAGGIPLVPGDAEVIIDGQIAPGQTVAEGPFGNHTGQYARRADCPVLQVDRIRLRKSPIMPLTVVGPPPSENVQLARGHVLLIREMLRIDCPAIRDLWMPEPTIFHGGALLSVDATSGGIGEVLAYLWNESPLRNARLLILFDADINPRDVQRSWWRLVNRLHPERVIRRDAQLAIDASGIAPDNLVSDDFSGGFNNDHDR